VCSCRFGLVPDRASARTGLVPTVFSSLSIPLSAFCSFSVLLSSLFSSFFSLLSFFSFVSCSNGCFGILAMTPLSDVRPFIFSYSYSFFNWAWPGLMVPSNKPHILLLLRSRREVVGGGGIF